MSGPFFPPGCYPSNTRGLFQSFETSADRKIPTGREETFEFVDRQKKKNGVSDRETFTKPGQYVSQNDKLPFTIAPNAVHFQA